MKQKKITVAYLSYPVSKECTRITMSKHLHKLSEPQYVECYVLIDMNAVFFEFKISSSDREVKLFIFPAWDPKIGDTVMESLSYKLFG